MRLLPQKIRLQMIEFALQILKGLPEDKLNALKKMNFSALAASDKNIGVSKKEIELTNLISKSEAF